MDFSAAIAGIDYWAVAIAALASFVIGGLWYSPVLFRRAWMESAGMTDAQLQSGKLGLIFGVSFVLQLIAPFVLAVFLAPAAIFEFGIAAGFIVGTAWVSTAFGVVYLFEPSPSTVLDQRRIPDSRLHGDGRDSGCAALTAREAA